MKLLVRNRRFDLCKKIMALTAATSAPDRIDAVNAPAGSILQATAVLQDQTEGLSMTGIGMSSIGSPSIDMRTPIRRGRSVQAKDVKGEPWSDFLISGTPNLWTASFNP